MMLQCYFETVPDTGLWRRYEAMKCASLLRETMWRMVSEITSHINFDYGACTAVNLDRFDNSFAQFTQQGNVLCPIFQVLPGRHCGWRDCGLLNGLSLVASGVGCGVA